MYHNIYVSDRDDCMNKTYNTNKRDLINPWIIVLVHKKRIYMYVKYTVGSTTAQDEGRRRDGVTKRRRHRRGVAKKMQ